MFTISKWFQLSEIPTMILVFLIDIPTILCVDWPNLLFWITCHIKLAECHFMLENFTNQYIDQFIIETNTNNAGNHSQITPMTIENNENNENNEKNENNFIKRVNCDFILQNREFVQEYIEMYEECKQKSGHFSLYILNLISIVVFVGWYDITLWIDAISNDTLYEWATNGNKTVLIDWAVFFFLAVLYESFYCLSAIYSGILWSEYFQIDVKPNVNKAIEIIINNRTLFDQSFVLHNNNKKTSVDLFNNNKNDIITSIDVMRQYSKEEACLEILNHFIRILDEKPCVHSIFKITLDIETTKLFVIGFIIGKIISLMWNTVDLD